MNGLRSNLSYHFISENCSKPTSILLNGFQEDRFAKQKKKLKVAFSRFENASVKLKFSKLFLEMKTVKKPTKVGNV